jgi:hypothetical protein
MRKQSGQVSPITIKYEAEKGGKQFCIQRIRVSMARTRTEIFLSEKGVLRFFGTVYLAWNSALGKWVEGGGVVVHNVSMLLCDMK